jgi:hypothetical protein
MLTKHDTWVGISGTVKLQTVKLTMFLESPNFQQA